MGGNRFTQVEMNGTKICLNDYYHSNQAKVTYNVFRTRVINHLDIISEKLLYDALNLSKEDWISFYGGGKRKDFAYTGNYFSEYKNQTFPSLSSFLKLVGKYENYGTINRRVRVGWDIDEAILREIVDTSFGRIYLIETTKSPLKYVGQTIKTIEERFDEHKQDYNRPKRKNSSRLLYKAFEQFGVESFFIRLLEDNIENKQLAEKENYWINYYGTMYPNGLNMIKGNPSSVGYGKKIFYNGIEYSSVKKAVKEIQKERPDLPDYTIEKCIRHNRKLPVKPREQSKHSDAGTPIPIWRRWKSLLKKNELCSEWSILEKGIGYDNFINDMGCPISNKYKLYKRNNKLLHSKENSCWMTDTEIQEQENGISVVVFGKKYNSRSTLAKEYNLSLSTLNYRIEKRKMSAEEAVTYSGKTTQAISCEYDGIKFSSKGEMYRYCAEKYGLTIGQVKDCFERGISLEKKLLKRVVCTISGKDFETIKDVLAYYKLSVKTYYRIQKKNNSTVEETIKYLLEEKI